MDDIACCCICGSQEARQVWAARLPEIIEHREFSYTGNKRYHGRVVQCLSCRHMYVDPIPADTPNMYAQVEDQHYLQTESQRRITFSEFLDMKERFCPQRGTLLDIGCYAGVFLDVAKARHYDVEGIELSRWAASVARQRGHVVRESTIEDLAGDARRFDNITAFDVIEHLPNPMKAVTIIQSLLRPGGCFAGAVPDMGSWHARVLGRRHWLVVLMHYQYFTKHTFSEMLRRAGFSRFEIVAAPPYRARVRDAVKYAECTPLLKYPFRALKMVPVIRDLEIRLKASLFWVAWK